MKTVSRMRAPLLGYGCAIGAAMGYGGAQVVGKQIVGEVPAIVGAGFALLFGTLFMATLSVSDLIHPTDAPRRAYFTLAMAGICSSSGLLLLFLALERAPVVVVAPITGISPLLSILLAQLFIRDLEKVSLRMILGAILVVMGVALVVISRPT